MRFIALFITIIVFAVVGQSQPLAKHPDDLPESSGLYNDPHHSGIKVRVFVHPEKIQTTESQILACNLDDPQSESVVSAAGWLLPANWTYNLNPASVPSSVVGSNLPSIAANGFADWAEASGQKVNFIRGADTTIAKSAYDGKNIIAWGRTQGTALGVTYVRYYTSTGQVVDIDTIMNKKFQWRWSNSSMCAYSDAYDAENILTHELGHWMGLDDEYNATNYQHATMYGYGAKGEVKKNTLTTGDKNGTFSIYNP